MKNFLMLLLVIGTLVSCKKDAPSSTSACGVNNPAKNLPWLKKMIADERGKGERSSLKISMFHYKGETYFHTYQAHMSCLVCAVTDCSGKSMGVADIVPESEHQDFIKAALDDSVVVIWKGKSAY